MEIGVVDPMGNLRRRAHSILEKHGPADVWRRHHALKRHRKNGKEVEGASQGEVGKEIARIHDFLLLNEEDAMNGMDRRDFIRTVAIGGAVLGLGNAVFHTPLKAQAGKNAMWASARACGSPAFQSWDGLTAKNSYSR